MKKLPTISILALLYACGGMEIQNQEQVNIPENLQISIDSLVVDTAGEFFTPDMLYAQAQS